MELHRRMTNLDTSLHPVFLISAFALVYLLLLYLHAALYPVPQSDF